MPLQLLDRQAVIKELQKLKERAGARIILFGSVARNEHHELSDVDIIAIMPSVKPFHRRGKEIMDYYEGRLPIQVLIYTPEEFKRMKQTTALKEMLRGSIEI